MGRARAWVLSALTAQLLSAALSLRSDPVLRGAASAALDGNPAREEREGGMVASRSVLDDESSLGGFTPPASREKRAGSAAVVVLSNAEICSPQGGAPNPVRALHSGFHSQQALLRAYCTVAVLVRRMWGSWAMFVFPRIFYKNYAHNRWAECNQPGSRGRQDWLIPGTAAFACS